MSKRTFSILGPDGPDDVPMHWDRKFWQWVESGAATSATTYTKEEIFAFPPGELPTGAGCVVDRATFTVYPLPPGEGAESKI